MPKKNRLQEYIIPTSSHEVTLEELYKYFMEVDPLKPLKWEKIEQEPQEDNRQEMLNSLSDKFIDKQLRPFFEANVCFWASLPVIVAQTYSMEELTQFYYLTQMAVKPAKYEYKKVLKVLGEFYELPGENMEDAILFQYAEADQEQQNAERENINRFYTFPKVMALLLRKQGESKFLEYKEVMKRTEHFKKATLSDAWQVYVYFEKTKAAIKKKYGKTLFGEAKTDEKKAGVKGLQEAFGWLLTIKRLAEKKIFDVTGYNSQDSVLRTNLWECLTHLSCDNAINTFQERLYEIKYKK
jgi:hypothetical protein